ncbi:LysR substrate-binding domain-containing protein [Rhodococcus sp. IEGM 1354]|nr:LysR substrate-binding domain-containing protein [Rhodococcus sp. IEGM 1354]MDI9933685.1 LysR substrate-binding domain-containing protein [Rhodococcus sp. IEGM 1354]NIL91914.1 Hydrogen peroxide-inducible genes activator [Rhodococcus fascians]
MLNLHRMRLLVELSRRGTIGQVAEALSYSASTVSQQLGQLENEAGVPLLEQVGRRVRLTNAGELLVRHAEGILQQVERAQAALAATRSDIVGEVRVATFQTAAMTLIPRVLEEMNVRHPDLTLYLTEIQPDSATSALQAGEFDLILGEEYPGYDQPQISGIDRKMLFEDPMRIYVADKWKPNRDRKELADFADVPWILEPKGKPARDWAETACRAAGFVPRVRFESADLLVLARLAETGHGATLLPDLVWDGYRPQAQFVSIASKPARQVYTAVRTGAEARPVLVELRNILVSVSDRRIDVVQ